MAACIIEGTLAPSVLWSGRAGTEERWGFLLALVASDGLPPYVAAPADDSLGRALHCCGRPHIEVEDGLACGLRLARVVVDDVSDLLRLSIDVSGDEPVVAIKRRLGAKDVLETETW